MFRVEKMRDGVPPGRRSIDKYCITGEVESEALVPRMPDLYTTTDVLRIGKYTYAVTSYCKV